MYQTFILFTDRILNHAEAAEGAELTLLIRVFFASRSAASAASALSA
ncbi:MAG: hypothetical protein ACI8YQ_004776 [Polaribacter sp.]|jgi:hypothetical protein